MIFYVHPYLRKIPILTSIFQWGWFNHHLENLRRECSSSKSLLFFFLGEVAMARDFQGRSMYFPKKMGS